jgi:poly-gamma-glutamate synthesis protein (capsule biosynthesis protein)
LALSTSDISPVGGGRDLTEARAGIVRDVRGTKIGYLAYTDILPASAGAGPSNPGANIFDMAQMREDIAALRSKADVIAVSFHTGDEYQTTHNERQEQIYHAAIDAGADLVIGSHPHVVQEVERYREGWVAYSLGNFVFDQNFSEETMRGLMLSVQVRRKHIAKVQQLPIAISAQYQPSVLP